MNIVSKLSPYGFKLSYHFNINLSDSESTIGQVNLNIIYVAIKITEADGMAAADKAQPRPVEIIFKNSPNDVNALETCGKYSLNKKSIGKSTNFIRKKINDNRILKTKLTISDVIMTLPLSYHLSDLLSL